MIRGLGKAAGEHPEIIDLIVTQRQIGLTIRRFHELCSAHGYRIHRKDLFLFRPVFQVRYGLPTRRMVDIPAVREFLVLGCECLLRKAPAPAAS